MSKSAHQNDQILNGKLFSRQDWISINKLKPLAN